MFNFDMWELIGCSYLTIDREYEGNQPATDWDYIVELPQPSNGYTHVVEVAVTELSLPPLEPCDFEEAADAEFNLNNWEKI